MLKGRIPRNPHNEAYMKAVMAEAKAALAEPNLSLPYTEYRRYGLTGDRVGYEAHYIRHRKRLGLFTLACLWEENDEAYFCALLDAVWAILDEYSWALPAHLQSVPLERKDRQLDLFAAETSLAFCDVLSLLGDRFPEEVIFRMKTELRRRLLEPFFREEVKYLHSNWSAVQLSGKAYGDGVSLFRTLGRAGNGAVILTDDCRTGQPIVQRIVTLISPTVTGDTVRIDDLTVISEHPVTVSVTETSYTPRRIISAGDTFADTPLYLIDFIPQTPTAENRLTFRFD